MKNRIFFSLIFVMLSGMLWASGPALELPGPNKQLQVVLYTENGKLLYRVAAGALTLIEPAALGLRVDNRTLGREVQQLRLLRQVTIREQRPSRLNSTVALNHCVEYTILIQQKDITDTISFRVFDNGCAFRYQPAGNLHALLQEELTSFTFPATSRVWYFERNNNWKLKSYAGLWMSTTPDRLPSVSSQGPIQGKPLVAEFPGNKYMVITEAALYGYSGMRLKAIGGNAVQVNFTEGESGFAVNKRLQTPWRVVLFARSLDELVKNKIIENLNPLPDQNVFADQSWIKPGISVWSWITRNEENYMQPAEEMKFIDAAAELNFQFSLIDEGWETKWPYKWKQLKELCEYASKKKIGVWVWKHSKDILDTIQRNQFLDSIRSCGAVGLKTDFMNSEEKSFVDFEIGLLRAAAQRKLMVNFHGCQAPTGESVPFPNEMTREGIRGLELNIMNEPIPAWHNAALPFTRLLLGHGDYTPAFFSNKANTTYTHQLALLYLFNSPFQCIAENPLTLLNDPKYKPILPLLRSLPVTWDETIVLKQSEIGRLAAFARRKGNNWYVAVINGTGSASSFKLDPSFIRTRKTLTATVIRDAAGDAGFIKEEKKMKTGNHTKLTIPANGGLLIQIKN
ncbi:glycoside hydrolase family 97 protein [Pseudobacter ginsenosidimutans]|uniref:Alpha-glucosidase n=1 Tax=Pseudobacter ginsenosidimutans TaxID=661488 RepID=A0A4Q7MZZ0_9BACT|nr:glycoside hydrolase family 97 protein [Pseudobacter ginsenosidimutans]QEC43193.1 glycoside hydrolase family 97 protein [Pseudobacter ginsenosidimutans]RZS74553.1 alpha-glucosidase [Pseudobacter ginsenosidimutans]